MKSSHVLKIMSCSDLNTDNDHKEYVYVTYGYDTTGELRTVEVFSSEESAKASVVEIWNELAPPGDEIKYISDLRHQNNVYWFIGSNPCIAIEKKEVRK